MNCLLRKILPPSRNYDCNNSRKLTILVSIPTPIFEKG